MKTITRRLHRLEERFGLQPETEFDQPPEKGPPTEACCRRFMEAFGVR
jgi:hypothetical protein